MQRQRDRGWSWAALLDTQGASGLLRRLRHSARRVGELTTRMAEMLARGLSEEGESRPEGGLRYLDVWESEEACDRFGEERLHPVVHSVLREVFGKEEVPPEPERAPLPVVHVWGSGRTVPVADGSSTRAE